MKKSGVTRNLSTVQILICFLVLSIFILGIMWFLKNFEKKPYEVRLDVSPAVRNNRLLAAQRYLEVLGQQVESRQDMEFFTRLPPPSDTILLQHMPGGMGKAITEKLYQWVQAGGHLLLTPAQVTSSHPGSANILEKIGVHLIEDEEKKSSDCSCSTEEQEETPQQISEEASPVPEEEITQDRVGPVDLIIQETIGGHPVKLEYFGSTLLDDQNSRAVFRIDGTFHKVFTRRQDIESKDDEGKIEKKGSWLLQFKVGEGAITVLCETELFTNANLKSYDNAFFLSWLVHDAEKVWLINAVNMDPLLLIAWNKAPHFWISFLVLVSLVIWKMQKRSGLLHKPQSDDRRNILDYIDATGHFSWGSNRSSLLIAANRKSLLRLLAARKLGKRSVRDIKAADLMPIAKEFNIPEYEFHDAFSREVNSEQSMIQTSRALQKIQKSILGREARIDDKQ